jgi:aldehyde dehydrogenase (NAD+)
MANAGQFKKVLSYIQSARDEGARIVYGGDRPQGLPVATGYFLMPTVVADARHDMTVVQEEIFGPVACILKYSTDEEAIALANDSRYGLCAGVWSRDAAKAASMTDALRVDSVFVNMPRMMANEFPWGGNVKESGVGTSESVCGLEEFTGFKFVCTSYA